MPAADAGRVHYAQRQLAVGTAAAMVAGQWGGVDEQRIAESWLSRLPVAVAMVSAAQYSAAALADPYVATALEDPLLPYAVVAGAFAGVAADGRALASLLYQPAITALAGVGSGRPVAEALRLGAVQLDTLVRTEVADAGRTADQVAATVQGAEGYVRLLTLPSCSRCVILAGRVYKWSTGFQRHPRCDCVMLPVADVDAADVQTPESAYRAMSPEQRSAAGWNQADQQAIADGADVAAVTNIHRGGLYVAGGRQFTYEGTGRRRRRARITPRQIYREARGNRAEAIRLLKLHDYIR